MTVKTFVLSCACAVTTLGAVPTLVSSDKPVIALSNAYYGNAWRHQMVDV
jgi:ribose transport system substrate-binding protein